MKRAGTLAYCRAKAGARETYPFGDEVAVFKVGGKIFALCALNDSPATVNLKCDPALGQRLRRSHAAVQPGYHMNKKHWNTVVLDGSLRPRQIRDMIDHSYDLVVASLPGRLRDRLSRPQMPPALFSRIAKAAKSIDGVVQRESRFAPVPAWWVDGREVVHVDTDGSLDIRVTRKVIVEHRELFRTDDRVQLRPGDWLTFHVAGPGDVPDAADIIAMAVEANRRPPAGRVRKTPTRPSRRTGA